MRCNINIHDEIILFFKFKFNNGNENLMSNGGLWWLEKHCGLKKTTIELIIENVYKFNN
jgi:hypothetical protein